MPSNRQDLLRSLIPAVVAVVLTLIYFAVFNRWDKLADPINSIVTIVLGFVGFGVGAVLDIQRARRGRTSTSNPSAPQSAG